MSSIYERPVTRSWTEFSIKVRSLTIGELQLLARWLIDKVGEERAEVANAVRFEVRGDDDEAELVAIVDDQSSSPAAGLVPMRDVLFFARRAGGMKVAASQASVMMARIMTAVGHWPTMDVVADPGDAIHLLGVLVEPDASVAPDCVRVVEQDYVLTAGSDRAYPMPWMVPAPELREALDAARRDETGSTEARP